MTNHMPLNGNRVIDSIHSALRGQTVSQTGDSAHAPQQRLSAADAARYALEGVEFPDDAPDGTGGATKSEPATGSRTATDPSQGRGPAPRRSQQDPLVSALSRITGSRRRF